jgi:hypothetical protein
MCMCIAGGGDGTSQIDEYIPDFWSFDLSDNLQQPHRALVVLTYFLHLLSSLFFHLLC